MPKLFKFLHQLSSLELKKFQELVNVPYFNKREDLQRLLKIYVQSPKKRMESTLRATFEKTNKMAQKDWHLLCSRLYKLGERFLILETLQEKEGLQKRLLAEAFRARKQPVEFSATIQNGKKNLTKRPIRDSKFWLQTFTLENEYYDFIASHDRKKKSNLQAITDTLDTFFISQKLKTACFTHARATINQEDNVVHFLPEILAYVAEEETVRKTPAVEVYYLCYQAITDQQNEHWFTELRQSIERNQACFARAEQRDLLLFATNYCIRRLNEGKAIFIREAFELYCLNLSAGFLIEDGILPESTFGNIVTLAAKLKEYSWAKTFIEENKSFLKPIFQTPLFHFSMGRLHYEEGDFDTSLQHLLKVETKAGFLLLGTKILQLKIYFEQQEFDLMEYLLDSLRVYLQRRKDLGYRKQNYEQILYFFRKLIEVPFLSKIKQQAFRKEVENAQGFSEKEWVLERLGQR